MLQDHIEEFPSHYFDKNGDLKTYEHNLTHWEQTGKLQYITFRLADSLPQVALDELRRLKEKVQKENPHPWSLETSNKFKKMTMERIEYWLEQAHGECVLRRQEVRNIVVESFEFVRNRCAIPAYVIMPNHIHLLILCNKDEEWSNVVGSVKQYTARRINKQLGRKGKLWQTEPYNRIVRNEDHFLACVSYIRNNPKFLPESDYTLYIDQQEISYIRHHRD